MLDKCVRRVNDLLALQNSRRRLGHHRMLVYGAVKHADFIMALGQSIDLSTGCGDL
jgi:hypothetical protein